MTHSRSQIQSRVSKVPSKHVQWQLAQPTLVHSHCMISHPRGTSTFGQSHYSVKTLASMNHACNTCETWKQHNHLQQQSSRLILLITNKTPSKQCCQTRALLSRRQRALKSPRSRAHSNRLKSRGFRTKAPKYASHATNVCYTLLGPIANFIHSL